MHNPSDLKADGLSAKNRITVALHGLTKTGQKEIRKMLPGLISWDFCCHIGTAGPEFGINNMKAWSHPASYKRFMLGIFPWHTLSLLLPNEHRWNAYLSVSIILWLQCAHLPMAPSSKIMHHVTELKASQSGCLNMTMSSLKFAFMFYGLYLTLSNLFLHGAAFRSV